MERGLRFRKANNADLDTIAAIYDRTHDAEEAGLTTTGWVRGIYPKREVAGSSLERGDMYVAELDGRIAASGIINKTQVNVYLECDWEYSAPDDEVCVLHTLVVDPELRGQGIGSAFVGFYEATARELGCEVLRIDTNAWNKAARGMYAKLGYIETDIVPTVFNGIRNVDLVLLEKKVEETEGGSLSPGERDK